MSSPDPSRIVDVLCAYWQTAALIAAIDLGVFTALGGRARSASELAGVCRADRASLERLCDFLVSLGLLRSANGRYRAAADAARFLDARSPESLAAIPGFFNAPPVSTALADLSATVRGRKTAASSRVWPAFATSTLALRRRAAKEIASVLVRRGLGGGRILDVGAGASPLGIELLRRCARRHAGRAGSRIGAEDGPATRESRRRQRASRVGRRGCVESGLAGTIRPGPDGERARLF